ncbi:MAG: VWA domain-containing protein, partial [Bacteroidota bacterium]
SILQSHNLTVKVFLLSGVMILVSLTSFSQKKKSLPAPPMLTRIEFLFDASQSMYGKWQTGAKIDVAKRLMNQLLDSLRYVPDIELALRVYGHQKPFPPQDCDDSRLEVPFGKGNVTNIQQVLKNVTPRGTTPIAHSLELCGNDFPQEKSRNIIILITDGIEECGGDPCATSAALQSKGIVLKPFVIGLGLDADLKKMFDCVGKFYDAENETTFENALNIVIKQALNATTMQVNLLDTDHRPTETNVNMTFYDQRSGAIKYNFIHTLNSKGVPDTLIIDPNTMYRIVAHTIPPVSKDSVQQTAGKHNIVGIDAPQGYLFLKMNTGNEYKKLQAIVRQRHEMNTLNVQEVGSNEKYITGKYDLEILTLPRMNLEGVSIDQSKTTTIEIPQPGMVSFITNSTGYGSIYSNDKGKLKWIANLDDNQTKETFVMQPGEYKVIYRPKASRESVYTMEKIFKIVSGTSVAVTF